MSNKLIFFVIFTLTLIVSNCSSKNKKTDMYNYINDQSINEKMLSNGKEVYKNIDLIHPK